MNEKPPRTNRLARFARKIEPDELKIVVGGWAAEDDEREPASIVRPKPQLPGTLLP